MHPKNGICNLSIKGSHKTEEGAVFVWRRHKKEEGVGVSTRLLRFGSSLSLDCVHIQCCCEWKRIRCERLSWQFAT